MGVEPYVRRVSILEACANMSIANISCANMTCALCKHWPGINRE